MTGGFTVDNLCNELLPALIFHARIAYQRGYGNTDPDVDPYYAYEPLAASAVVVRR